MYEIELRNDFMTMVFDCRGMLALVESMRDKRAFMGSRLRQDSEGMSPVAKRRINILFDLNYNT